MSYHNAWPIPNASKDQELMETWQQAFAHTGYHPAYEMQGLLSYPPYTQGPQLPVFDSSSSASLLMADWEWPLQNIPVEYPKIAQDASSRQTQLAPEAKTFPEEPLAETQELKQVVLRLQHRAEKLEERFGNLQNEWEAEKTRLCEEIEASVKKLESWALDLKRTVDDLAGKLKTISRSK